VFVYRLAEPLDEFDGLTSMPDWLRGGSQAATRWALQAVLALADAGPEIGWRGDMRHLPSVGAVPTPPGVTAYLVVQQDDNGITFVVTDADGGWIVDVAAACVRVETRPIGAWTHPLREDVPDTDETSVAGAHASGHDDTCGF
jgi:hypothetical protein